MSEPTFWDCVKLCATEPAFVREFDRLTGYHLSTMGGRPVIHAMIDDATGRDREALVAFLGFVWEFVWTRTPTDTEEPSNGE